MTADGRYNGWLSFIITHYILPLVKTSIVSISSQPSTANETISDRIRLIQSCQVLLKNKLFLFIYIDLIDEWFCSQVYSDESDESVVVKYAGKTMSMQKSCYVEKRICTFYGHYQLIANKKRHVQVQVYRNSRNQVRLEHKWWWFHINDDSKNNWTEKDEPNKLTNMVFISFCDEEKILIL